MAICIGELKRWCCLDAYVHEWQQREGSILDWIKWWQDNGARVEEFNPPPVANAPRDTRFFHMEYPNGSRNHVAVRPDVPIRFEFGGPVREYR